MGSGTVSKGKHGGIVGLILVLLVIWIALNIIGGLLGPGSNGLFLGVILLVAILWYFDYI